MYPITFVFAFRGLTVIISPFANSEYVKGQGDNRSRDRTGKKQSRKCASRDWVQRTFYTHARFELCMLAHGRINRFPGGCKSSFIVLKIRYSTVKISSAYRHRNTLVTIKIKYPGTNIIIPIFSYDHGSGYDDCPRDLWHILSLRKGLLVLKHVKINYVTKCSRPYSSMNTWSCHHSCSHFFLTNPQFRILRVVLSCRLEDWPHNGAPSFPSSILQPPW